MSEEFRTWVRVSLSFFIAGTLVVGGLIAAATGFLYGFSTFGWWFLIGAPFLGGLIVFVAWWIIVLVKYVFDWATKW